MFVPFARPLFASHDNTDPSAPNFSFCAQIQWGKYLRSTDIFHPIQATCVPDQWRHGPGKPFSGWNWIFPQYDPYQYCGAISSPKRASQRIYWHLEKSLSFHSPFSCFVLASVCLTSMHFIITRLIKQLKSCRCASVYMLRIAESCGQSTSHSRILSRYSSWVLREKGNNGSAHGKWKCTFQD